MENGSCFVDGENDVTAADVTCGAATGNDDFQPGCSDLAKVRCYALSHLFNSVLRSFVHSLIHTCASSSPTCCAIRVA